jgi:NAD(P)-dependent dehydrogenase (short-subunit alcohol dehydrogenase family)
MSEINKDLDLSGKRALVTGASRGIGFAIAERLAANGAKVALCSRKRGDLEDAASKLAAHGNETKVLPASLGDAEQIAGLVPAVCDAWGGIDILVNNAAANPSYCELVDLEERTWDKVMDTNVKGPFLLCKDAGKSMAAQGSGAIINIASIGGMEPSPMLGAYSISKASVIMLTKALAVELGPKGVRVNCIAPGLVETKFADVLVNTPELHEPYVARAALRRHGQPEEIAGAAHYLASEAASYMTGQVMVIDGGSRL